jgi:hypothetical protein
MRFLINKMFANNQTSRSLFGSLFLLWPSVGVAGLVRYNAAFLRSAKIRGLRICHPPISSFCLASRLLDFCACFFVRINNLVCFILRRTQIGQRNVPLLSSLWNILSFSWSAFLFWANFQNSDRFGSGGFFSIISIFTSPIQEVLFNDTTCFCFAIGLVHLVLYSTPVQIRNAWLKPYSDLFLQPGGHLLIQRRHRQQVAADEFTCGNGGESLQVGAVLNKWFLHHQID